MQPCASLFGHEREDVPAARTRGRGVVDLGGLEPPSPLCESNILPLEDRPGTGTDRERAAPTGIEPAWG